MASTNFTLINSGLGSLLGVGRRRFSVAVLIMLTPFLALAGCKEPAPAELNSPPTLTPSVTQATARPPLPARLQEQAALPAMVTVNVVGSGDEVAGTQRPAFLSAELAGRNISNVSLIGGDVAEDGQLRVLIFQPVDPDLGDDEWPGKWHDGVHELIQTWDFAGDFLWDGQNGDFAVLWTADPQADTRIAHGRFRAAGEEDYRNSVLVVDVAEGSVTDVVETATGLTLDHKAGDEFQLDNLILADDGALRSEPGTSLYFDDGAQLVYASRPAPSGAYFFGLSAESADGHADAGYASYSVDNDVLTPGYRAFFDPYRGYQLLYPETWSPPVDLAGLLTFNDPSGELKMSISTHPDMTGQPTIDLKNQALKAFGDVTVLYEDQVEIGQSGGLRTVYGYETNGGSRTGILLTFSQEGQAFIVDIDGPAADESTLLDLAGVVANSWLFRPVAASQSGRWTEVLVDGLPVEVPADYRYSEMSNDWRRFASDDEFTFMAFRSEPVAGRGLLSRMDHWTEVARRNVNDFAASNAYIIERGQRSWARVDFEYTDPADNRLVGAIMVTRIDDRFVVFWAEAPADRYSLLEGELFMVVVDELSNRLPPETGGGSSP